MHLLLPLSHFLSFIGNLWNDDGDGDGDGDGYENVT